MKTVAFIGFVRDILLPQLKKGDVVVMDNLKCHHHAKVKELIESVGARIEYLPVYSPEFNPIEMMWSQVKSVVHKLKTDSQEYLEEAIKVAISLVS